MASQADALAAKPGESVADHKSRVIEAAQAHTEAQKLAARASNQRPPDGFPLPPGAQSNIPDFMQRMGVTSPQASEPQSAPNSSPNGQQKPKNGAQEPEWVKLARERGWKTPEDAIRSYQALEKEFHAKNRELQQQRTQVPPPPAYTTPYPQVQPQWQPPQQVPVVQQMARRHGIAVEDAERLLPFVADVSRALVEDAVVAERSRYEPVIVDLSKKVQRSEELMEVAQDPAMRVPRVQYEVNKIFTENPSIFAYEAQPLRWALDRALRNIAQESLGAYQQQPGGNGQGYPSQPPVTAGSGTGAGGRGAAMPDANIDLAGSYFKLKTSAEKKEFLKQMGVASE